MPRYPNYGRSSLTHRHHHHSHQPHHDADEIKSDILAAYSSVHDAHKEAEPVFLPVEEPSLDEAPMEEMAMEEGEEE